MSLTKKTKIFCKEPMNGKSVLAVPGVGVAVARKLAEKSITTAPELYDVFIAYNSNRARFRKWAEANRTFANEKNFEMCYDGFRKWQIRHSTDTGEGTSGNSDPGPSNAENSSKDRRSGGNKTNTRKTDPGPSNSKKENCSKKGHESGVNKTNTRRTNPGPINSANSINRGVNKKTIKINVTNPDIIDITGEIETPENVVDITEEVEAPEGICSPRNNNVEISDPLESFFLTIKEVMQKLPLLKQVQVKSQIYNIVSAAEAEHLMTGNTQSSFTLGRPQEPFRTPQGNNVGYNTNISYALGTRQEPFNPPPGSNVGHNADSSYAFGRPQELYSTPQTSQVGHNRQTSHAPRRPQQPFSTPQDSDVGYNTQPSYTLGRPQESTPRGSHVEHNTQFSYAHGRPQEQFNTPIKR